MHIASPWLFGPAWLLRLWRQFMCERGVHLFHWNGDMIYRCEACAFSIEIKDFVMDCEYGCFHDSVYGFVVQAGCPVHDGENGGRDD